MSDSPFLAQSSRRARARAMRRRRRRRLLTAAAIALLAAAATATLLLSRSSITHDSASSHGGRQARRAVPGATKATLSFSGHALGRPPLSLDLSGEDPVRIAFRHPPRAGLLFDLNSGRVLWQRNPVEHLHIASLTKMMTALRVVRAAHSTKEPVLVTREAVDSAGSKVGVLPLGKHVRLKTMLYGLLLPSGNDAAVALAQHVSGKLSTFIDGMNEEAARLGMGCTHYSSPSGYVNAHNYSCAVDLAELAHVDLEQSLIAHIVRTKKAVLPFPIKGGKLYLYNNNPLLVYGYPGATGLKTGYTELAGNCLVATAERDGVKLGVVLLHSPELGRQAAHLLNAGFQDVYHQVPILEPPIPAGR